MSPTYRMPDVATGRRQAQIAEIGYALAAARCAARLAGRGTREFVVRELLLAVIEQIDRAATDLARVLRHR